MFLLAPSYWDFLRKQFKKCNKVIKMCLSNVALGDVKCAETEEDVEQLLWTLFIDDRWPQQAPVTTLVQLTTSTDVRWTLNHPEGLELPALYRFIHLRLGWNSILSVYNDFNFSSSFRCWCSPDNNSTNKHGHTLDNFQTSVREP